MTPKNDGKTWLFGPNEIILSTLNAVIPCYANIEDAVVHATGSTLYNTSNLTEWTNATAGVIYVSPTALLALPCVEAADLLATFARSCAIDICCLFHAPQALREFLRTGNLTLFETALQNKKRFFLSEADDLYLYPEFIDQMNFSFTSLSEAAEWRVSLLSLDPLRSAKYLPWVDVDCSEKNEIRARQFARLKEWCDEIDLRSGYIAQKDLLSFVPINVQSLLNNKAIGATSERVGKVYQRLNGLSKSSIDVIVARLRANETFEEIMRQMPFTFRDQWSNLLMTPLEEQARMLDLLLGDGDPLISSEYFFLDSSFQIELRQVLLLTVAFRSHILRLGIMPEQEWDAVGNLSAAESRALLWLIEEANQSESERQSLSYYDDSDYESKIRIPWEDAGFSSSEDFEDWVANS